jgi:hypothetical protein
MILAWDNKADGATIISVGSEIATLPGVNVQTEHLSQRWYTAAAVNSSFLIFDFGVAVSLSMLGIFGTNLTPTATYRLRASANPDGVTAAVYDSGSVSAGVKAGYGNVVKPFAATTAARYARLDIADATLTQLQIGRVFLGPSWSHSKALIYGWGVTPADQSPVMKSRGGQSFPDIRPKFRVLDFKLDFLTEAELFDNAFAMARDRGIVKSLLVVPLESSSYISEQSVWGLMQAYEPVIHRASQIFTHKFRIEERL